MRTQKIRSSLLALILLSSSAFAQRKYVGWSIGYFPSYDNVAISQINWKPYTLVAYFSINATLSGQQVTGVGGISAANAKSFTQAAHQNGCKAIICVGGAGAATTFEAATTSANLNTFVQSMVAFMQQNGFDGIDIDWEDDGQGITNSKYLALFQALHPALNNITPKPLLTVAAADYFASAAIPVAAYVDQMNVMSYYDDVTHSPTEMGVFTNGGVPKNKLGVGYGYDTDNEVDVNNPTDIAAKCLYSINNGYGGIMIWEITKACVACDDTTAYYVNKNPTPIRPFSAAAGGRGVFLSISDTKTAQTIEYDLPVAGFVDLDLYDLRGVRVLNLARGEHGPGSYRIALAADDANFSIRPGAYVVRLTTSLSSRARAIVVK